MAKVQGALFSIEASGQFAKAMIFDRRGHVRVYTSPTNSKTGPQGDVRQRMLATQHAIAAIGTTTKDAVKVAAPVSYRWNSYLVGEVIGSGAANFNAASAAFAALAPAEQADWDTEAGGINILPADIDYATAAAISEGQSLFTLAYTLNLLGIGPGAPDGTNAAAWATAVSS